MNCARTTHLLAFSLGVGVALSGCSQSTNDTNRSDNSTTPSRREVETERMHRAAAEQDATTPVARLFVNDDAIEVKDILRPLRKELTESAGAMTPQRYQEVLQARLIDEFRHQVRNLLLYQEAAKRLSERELELFEGYVDDAVRRQINDKYDGRQARYEQALIDQGMTAAEDRDQIRRELIVMRYLHQNITSRVLDPTRTELVRFFEERKESMTKPERRKMSLIEIPATDADAAQRIAEAKAELDGGAGFADVATKYSKGVHAEDGGTWDWLTAGSVREYWEPPVAQLFELAAGETSSIVDTGEAFFIVRCDAIDAAVPPDFEAMQPDLTKAYRDVQFSRMVEERVLQLQKQAIFVPENYGRFLQAVANAAPKPSEG